MRYIAFDFETFLIGTEYPEPYGYQGIAPTPVCLSYRELGHQPQLLNSYWAMAALIQSWMDDDQVVLIGQNVAFDLYVAVKHLDLPIKCVFRKYNKGLIKDTMLREVLLRLADGTAVTRPGLGYSLADLVGKYLKKDISASKGEDAWRLRYSELHQVPLEDWPQEAIDYPLDDATHTLKVYAAQHKLRRYFEANEREQTRAGFDLHLISAKSPRVHEGNVNSFKAVHEKRFRAAQRPLIKAGVLKPNPNRFKDFPKGDPRREGYSMDTKLLKSLIEKDYTKQGRQVPLTETGQVSTSGETLLGCKTRVLKGYGKAAGSKKMVEGFLPGVVKALASPDQRITTRYGVIMKTGRTSSSKVNIQNVSKEKGARECFQAPEGKVFVSVDFSSMEMYCLAQTMLYKYGIRKLLDTLNSGKDPHLMVSAGTMGKDYAEVLALYEADDELVGKYRALAKIMNFGFGGGMGAKTTLGNMDDKTVELLQELYPGRHLESVVKDLIADWKDQWELTSHFNKVGRLCQGGKKPTYTCPTTGRIKALNTYCQFCNMHFQPIAADALKHAIALIQESCWIPGSFLYEHGVECQIEIHDEVVMAGPEQCLREWVPEVQRLMVTGAVKVLPDCKIKTEAEVCGKFWKKKGLSVEKYLDKLES